MKLYSLSSLVLLLLFSSPLFAQFDGHNGQSSFYEEVEHENRPSFLKVEEESMLIERWQSALNILGLENVTIQEEIDLEEMQITVQQEWNQFQRANLQITAHIEQLESRNEQLRTLQYSLSQMVWDLEDENELFNDMGEELTESEADIVNENASEIQILALELVNYEMELAQNQTVLVNQLDALLDSETHLNSLNDEKEAVQILAATRAQFLQLQQYALAK